MTARWWERVRLDRYREGAPRETWTSDRERTMVAISPPVVIRLQRCLGNRGRYTSGAWATATAGPLSTPLDLVLLGYGRLLEALPSGPSGPPRGA
jgi:hypothetical protein